MDKRKLVLVSMTLANAMVLVDQTAVPLSLPNLMHDLGVGTESAQWVLTGSLLPLAGLLVLGGRLGDLVGRRKVFLTGCVLFAGASALGGISPTFMVLLVCRVLQGIGGALMLPNTVAIVGATFPARERGKALGTMGGMAAVAGALGPTIGGALTAAFSWRAVLLVNVPLAVFAVLATVHSVASDPVGEEKAHVDVPGAALLTVAIVGIIFGLTQSQPWGWTSPGVLGSLLASVAAGVAFVFVERRSRSPLMSFGLLRYPNYLAATASQFLAGMAEMGLALLFPLLLILNIGMPPGIAGLALIPTTLPMIVVAPLAGRWYDRSGGKPPLVAGFALLVLAGVLIAMGVDANDYISILPGLVVFGIALALVLTVNDPVTLDMVAEEEHGQCSGVSATAEQFGGAMGIAGLYLAFHVAYLSRLTASISHSTLPGFSAGEGQRFKDALLSAEQTGLSSKHFDPRFVHYLPLAQRASDHGYVVALLTVSVLAALGALIVGWLVRRPADLGDPVVAEETVIVAE